MSKRVRTQRAIHMNILAIIALLGDVIAYILFVDMQRAIYGVTLACYFKLSAIEENQQ